MDCNTLAATAAWMMRMALENLMRDGYVAFVVMVLKDQQTIPISVDSDDKEDFKERLGNFLRSLSPCVDAIIIISEAWMLSGVDIDAEATPRVSQHPKRAEAVFVTAQSPHGELLLTKTFERDANNKPLIGEGDVEQTLIRAHDGNRPTGNFCNLFTRAA